VSETTPEAPPKAGGKLGFWGKKFGPLPAWGWALILLGGGLAFLYWKNKNSSASTGAASADQSATGTDASLVPQFVNQTYTTVTPPSESPPPVTSPPTQDHEVYRDTAPGGQSLAQIAKGRGTTVQQLIATTTAAANQPGGLTAANLAKFNAYVKGGTNRPMPKGLVFYTSNPNSVSKGGVAVQNTGS